MNNETMNTDKKMEQYRQTLEDELCFIFKRRIWVTLTREPSTFGLRQTILLKEGTEVYQQTDFISDAELAFKDLDTVLEFKTKRTKRDTLDLFDRLSGR